jgi:hypothetical protein
MPKTQVPTIDRVLSIVSRVIEKPVEKIDYDQPITGQQAANILIICENMFGVQLSRLDVSANKPITVGVLLRELKI